ncbi:proline--tRNA ligase [Candidatus Roizmanbacteria bacterium RIFOXYB2_FULL_38_10]|uniref:Proline--tRNA ligase n=1 Tax=Candidatus Roizmanbacteria bacterium RIFOXYD1_FULL_38_12 TaxID=1802093 RepID=A0A1F7L0P9_9BACT|nr:MAG: proline--tRNA ligase [Candidatus Roizmanbacteria bacterium RIFOXYA2_FULL_38_14]OGK63695.1 MAG: proline--tRNA ligase [Candidatus Roizmanbacteria bacterium RIFOXYA1_FULL_37_12]OGK65541.1 MAG: proline--tRNA ligase [Candidatus Roizmanbacteria bacterium RIFOXYB1_FULL_40_23]OGK68325.1 MAG: proline--tRNA ligase [Candidatus Roizmanbacteria bacterium RIFOXYB2_FULL_38_10]OGK69946.1 MAG: proline--tRNA ligase [Candidatus Roizmanbacteria bacterium RIFOXYC1_FULL_38_14]OGK71812.1 MAG: proline--tRNA l
MLYSKLFGKTNKKSKEYNSVNATLLQKGGFIDMVMAGVYTYLPLGLKVLTNIENIIREEMNTIAYEVLMPSLTPKTAWEQTKRLNTVDVLMKTSPANEAALEKNNSEYILNPTHEEVVTPLAQKYNLSYKDFPFAVYQIQSKFRNEPRVKSGLLRGREFRMKDLYSFHTSVDDFKEYYEKAKEVYMNVFKKLGLGDDTVITLASGGSFTEDFSHEFQTICESGEDTLFYVKSKDTYYNKEVAPSKAPRVEYTDKEIMSRKDVLGENIIGVQELADFLHIPVEKTTKTLIFETDKEEIVAAAVRGGYDISEDKLKKIVGCKTIKLASKEDVKRITKAEVGYAGVLNLPPEVKVFFDESTDNRMNFETGANRTHYHSINVNFGRDLPYPDKFYDFKVVKEGDMFPATDEVYKVFKASEVGNIFPLYTKFTASFDYTYKEQNGKEKPVYMGCYGIGSSRIMGVIVEKFHDEKGIVWPKSVAPFQVHLISIGKEEVEKKRGDQLYKDLKEKGVDVLYDDREVSPGEKFADADLIGIPVRLVVSKKTGDKVEYKERAGKETQLLSLEEVMKRI